MVDTFVVSTNLNDAVCAQERLHVYQNPANVDGFIDPTLNGFPGQETEIESSAAFGIWNGTGSARKITIIDATVNEVQGRTTTGAVQSWDLTKVSAVSGGIDIPVVPMDTNNSSLPSQVQIRRRVNITGSGSSFRKILDLPQMNATRTVEYMHALRGGAVGVLNGNLGTGLLVSTYDTNVQPIVLREGEGIAVLIANNVGREFFPVEMSVWLDVSGSTYFVRYTGHPEAFGAALSVFNGSGSGVVINVLRIAVSEAMDDSNVSGGMPIRLTWETFCGLSTNSLADAITPTPMDSTNASLPSQIVVAAPCNVLQINPDSILDANFTRTNEYPIRRLARASFGVGPGLGLSLHSHPVSAELNGSISWPYGDNAFTLRPGEGLGLFQRDRSGGWGHGFWVRVVFTVETIGEKYTPSAFGGSTVYGGVKLL